MALKRKTQTFGPSLEISKYSERALVSLGAGLPAMIYLPPHLRGKKAKYVSPDGVVTKEPPPVGDQIERIQQADPLGFLIALMQGQPIPVYVVKGDKVLIEYHVPSMQERERIALVLHKAAMRPDFGGDRKKPEVAEEEIDEFEKLVEQRARDAKSGTETDNPDEA